MAESILGTVRAVITRMLERWSAAGGTLSVEPPQLTAVLLSLVQGFVVQNALSGQPSADEFCDSVTTLFSAAAMGPATHLSD